jgi:hypothetical protein
MTSQQIQLELLVGNHSVVAWSSPCNQFTSKKKETIAWAVALMVLCCQQPVAYQHTWLRGQAPLWVRYSSS